MRDFNPFFLAVNSAPGQLYVLTVVVLRCDSSMSKRRGKYHAYFCFLFRLGASHHPFYL